jgi:hypothetical protein
MTALRRWKFMDRSDPLNSQPEVASDVEDDLVRPAKEWVEQEKPKALQEFGKTQWAPG